MATVMIILYVTLQNNIWTIIMNIFTNLSDYFSILPVEGAVFCQPYPCPHQEGVHGADL